MYYKILNEDGLYQNIDTKEVVNLISGKTIHTPNGLVTDDNLQGYVKFDTEAEALTFFNIELIPIEN